MVPTTKLLTTILTPVEVHRTDLPHLIIPMDLLQVLDMDPRLQTIQVPITNHPLQVLNTLLQVLPTLHLKDLLLILVLILLPLRDLPPIQDMFLDGTRENVKTMSILQATTVAITQVATIHLRALLLLLQATVVLPIQVLLLLLRATVAPLILILNPILRARITMLRLMQINRLHLNLLNKKEVALLLHQLPLLPMEVLHNHNKHMILHINNINSTIRTIIRIITTHRTLLVAAILQSHKVLQPLQVLHLLQSNSCNIE